MVNNGHIFKTYLFEFSAEFIIHLADKHQNYESFKKALDENGASFSVSLLFFTQTK